MAVLAGVVFDRLLGNWATLCLATLLLYVGFVASQTTRAWYRLRHFKGPFLASFSKLWLVQHIWGGEMHLAFAAVCSKYGPLARVGPNDLVTSDPEVMRRMLAVRSPYRRSDWYIGMRFDPSRDNVESERDEEKHAQLRAKMAAGYSGKEVENLEQRIDRNVLALIKLLNTKYVPTSSEYKPLDFGRKAQYFTLDVISEVAFGKSFGYLDADADLHDYLKTTEEVLPAVMMVTVLPWMNWLLQLSLVKKFLPSDKDPLGFGKIMAITKQVVGERFGPNKKTQRDMLGSFVHHGLSQDEAESETILQIVAGSDTTATAIRATFLHIITNQRVYSKLLAEISSATISSPIKVAEAKTLPYLQAVIKEGLRIHPPVAGLMAKEVPPEGDTIHGLYVPGGTSIGYCAWGIFRDKKAWGEDADEFRPERWLEGSAENIKQLELTLELIFSYGKYQCLGKNVAMMELNKIFVELLRHFEFSVVYPAEPWKSVCNGIFTQTQMWMTISRRESEHYTRVPVS